MRVIFRVDASPLIGSGHLMRCLTLADALRAEGAEVDFLCRPGPTQLYEQITMRGHRRHEVRVTDPCAAEIDGPPHAAWLGWSQMQDASASLPLLAQLRPDWLVVDHYAIDRRWHATVRAHVGNIMVIDDLADRMHDCDLLLDQNYFHDLELRYAACVEPRCEKLLGPTYALLRPEFSVARAQSSPRRGVVRRVLVFFGGSDSHHLLNLVLDAVQTLGRAGLVFDFVVGQLNPSDPQLEERCARFPGLALHAHVSNMAQLMTAADIAIGAGGSTTLERCYLGLPTLAVDIAENQTRMLHDLASAGYVRHLGAASALTVPLLARELDRFIDDSRTRVAMSERGMSLVNDGTAQVASRIKRTVHV